MANPNGLFLFWKQLVNKTLHLLPVPGDAWAVSKPHSLLISHSSDIPLLRLKEK